MASAQKLNSVTSTNPLIPGLPDGNNEIIFSWFREDHSVAYNRVPNSVAYANISNAPIFKPTYGTFVPYQFAYNTNIAETTHTNGRTYIAIYRRALEPFANATGATITVAGANNSNGGGRPRLQIINANNMLQLTGLDPSPNGATLQVSGNTSRFRFIAAVMGNNDVSKIYNLTDATESSETYIANVTSLSGNSQITIGSSLESATANRGLDLMLFIATNNRLTKNTIDEYYESIKQTLFLNEGFTDI